MRLTFKISIILLALLLGPAGFAAAVGDLNIDIMKMDASAEPLNHGYSVRAVVIRNMKPQKSEPLVFWAQSQTGRRIREEKPLNPNSTVAFYWATTLSSHTLYVSPRGREFSDRTIALGPLDMESSRYGGSQQQIVPNILISRRLDFDTWEKYFKIVRIVKEEVAAPAAAPAAFPIFARKKSATEEKKEGEAEAEKKPSFVEREVVDLKGRLRRAEMAGESWFQNWLAYSCYEGVILTEQDLKLMPVEVKDAILKYVELGGVVCAVGADTFPTDWKNVKPYPSSGNLEIMNVGFGKWIQVAGYAGGKIPEAAARDLQNEFNYVTMTSDQIKDRFGAYKVVKDYKIPVFGIVTCLMIFLLLAGPLNIMLMGYLKRQIWLYWTTPALSVIFSVILLVSFYLSEGVFSRSKVSSVVVLNEKAKRSATLGVEGLYCPLSPFGGIKYKSDWEVISHYKSGEEVKGGVDMSDGQLFSGFVQPRVQSYFALRGAARSTARASIRNDSGRLTLGNGLGGLMRKFYYRDDDGTLYEAEDVKPGQECELRKCTGATLDILSKMTVTRIGRAENFYRAGAWIDEGIGKEFNILKVAEWLDNGRYAALLDRNPFLEKGLPSATSEEFSLVLGISDSGKGGVAK